MLPVLGLLPLLYAAGDYYWGVLMYRRSTRPMRAAKAASLVVLVAGVVLNTTVWPGRPEAGVAALVCGEAVESAIPVLHGRRQSRNVQRSIESAMGDKVGSP